MTIFIKNRGGQRSENGMEESGGKVKIKTQGWRARETGVRGLRQRRTGVRHGREDEEQL